MNALLTISNLKIRFDLPDGEVKAVNDLNLELYPSQSLGIVGESGSGKTQFVLSILRLLAKNARLEGEILYQGRNLITLSQSEMRKIRGAEIAMIFQDPMTSLNPYLTIERQMTEVLEIHRGMSRKAATEECIRALEMVEIPEARKRIRHYPHQMSGGMRQRIVIAMALLCKPKILLADEPTTALDVTVQAQILALLRKLRVETGVSVVLITHNLGVVASVCDEVAVMYSGRIVEKNNVSALFHHPAHPYTEGLLRSMPRMDAHKGRLLSIPGQPPNLQRLPKGCPFVPRCDYQTPRCKEALPPLEKKGEALSACFESDKLISRSAAMV